MKKLFFSALIAVAALSGALAVNAQYSGYLADGTPRNCRFIIGYSCSNLVLYDSPIHQKSPIDPSIYEDYFYPVVP
ncbi:hypothetical protein [Pedobacter hiemivivus]|uniref:Uncharacterized protein n=1 Tax=Pedobacter hiemivivus TaxID=2530454 RepID=A0A4R0NGJ5_9SPHI|nr:hypothetical protein [Pedobacter hiemivivus]TCC99565.1 hypothetical protein EZ444_02500 [Pedobacter hiemivivus]